MNRKEPITADILFAIINKFNNENVNDLRLCPMMLLAYAGFLRYMNFLILGFVTRFV